MSKILVNGLPIKRFNFSAGECYVKLTKEIRNSILETRKVNIYAPLFSSDLIMDLFLTIDAINNFCAHSDEAEEFRRLVVYKYGAESLNNTQALFEFIVEMPYIPYSRQDRVCTTGESRSIRVFWELLVHCLERTKKEICYIVRIECIDPHSARSVLTDRIDYREHSFNMKNTNDGEQIGISIKTQIDLLEKYIFPIVYDNEEDCSCATFKIVLPDAGAISKFYSMVEARCNRKEWENLSTVEFNKTRNEETGEINGIEMLTEKNNRETTVKNKNLIIIDDICDGGRTFIEIAKILRERDCGKLYLYVTHGIFAKGLDVLRPYFDHIFCYHLIKDYVSSDDPILTVFKESST